MSCCNDVFYWTHNKYWFTDGIHPLDLDLSKKIKNKKYILLIGIIYIIIIYISVLLEKFIVLVKLLLIHIF
jgi:hypothetical protein